MKPGGITEEQLAMQMQARDAKAMRQFYDLTSGYLAAVCSRYIPEADEAKDVLQDSFIKIFGSIGQFEYRGEGSLRAWATRIVVNESLMALRQRARRSTSLSDIGDVPDVPDIDPEPDEVPPEELLQYIQELPAGYRMVFNLYVFEQKSHKEIARMLNIKESSSASQLHRAKALLAKRINDYKASKQ